MRSAELHRENREASGEESYGRFLYNRHRYYSPEVGRYISADPIGQFGALALDGVALSRLTRLPAVDPEPVDAFPRMEAIATTLRDAPLLSGSSKQGVFPHSNLYAYAIGRPTGIVDPTGEFGALGLAGAILGAVSAGALLGATAPVSVPIAVAGVIVGGIAAVADYNNSFDDALAQGNATAAAVCDANKSGPQGQQLGQVMSEP